jgi:RNA polymerase sigma-54 factor
VFAWSLAESFRLQLQARNRFDPLIERLLERLDLIACQDIDAICEACNVDREDAVEMLDDIRALTPTPLARQADGSPSLGEPELIIRADPGGACTASLNEAALPRLLTDDALFSATMAVETDAHARSYYRDCYRGAANIVRAMQKRANTLLAAGQAIADRQHRFIQTGRARDKLPLTMSQLAQVVGVNKSTISRALANCRVRTGLGVLPAARFLARPLSDRAPDRTPVQVNLLGTCGTVRPYFSSVVRVLVSRHQGPSGASSRCSTADTVAQVSVGSKTGDAHTLPGAPAGTPRREGDGRDRRSLPVIRPGR